MGDIYRIVTTIHGADDAPELLEADDGKVLAWDFGTQAFVAAELSADEGIDLSDFSNGQMPYVLDSAFAPSGLTWESSRMTVNGDIELTGQEITDANYQKYLSAIRINGEPLYRAITAVWDGSAWDADAGSIGLGFYALRKNTGKQCTSLGFNSLYNNSGNNVVGAGAYAGSGNTGYRTSGLGGYAIYQNAGDYCNGFGYYALYRNVGDYNCGYGNFALSGCGSSRVTAFGHGAGNGIGAGYNNTTLLGYGAMPTQANQVVLGDLNVNQVLTYGCFVADFSNDTSSAYTAVHVVGNDLYGPNSIKLGAIGGGPAISFSDSSVLYLKAIGAHSLELSARVNNSSYINFRAAAAVKFVDSANSLKFAFDYTSDALCFFGAATNGTDLTAGSIAATLINDNDASYQGQVVFKAFDFAGGREGICLEADGTQPLIGMYGADAVAQAGAITLATASHSLGSTYGQTELEGVLDALSSKINLIIAAMTDIGICAAS